MSENVIDYEKLRTDLIEVVGMSAMLDPLIGAMVSRLDEQPTRTGRKKQPELTIIISGWKYTLSHRDGAVWLHSGGLEGYFSEENLNSISETFERLTEPPA
jgi:hypothetical protein